MKILSSAALRDYFCSTIEEAAQSDGRADAAVSWRMQCYEDGARYREFIESNYFPVAGRQVLDAACAWGGHAMAFAEGGAHVVASDLNDHRFAGLARFVRSVGLDVSPLQADCMAMPFADSRFDVVLAFELIEHIPDVDRLAAEIARVLRPGGVALVSTPARLRSVVEGEPHYQLKGLALLPFSWQGFVASRIFSRRYPFPIERQYLRASSAIGPFTNCGLAGVPILRGRLGRICGQIPGATSLASELCWNFIAVQKPA